MKNFDKKRNGFTLIECLISVALLLVVAFVVYSVTDKFAEKISDKNNNFQFESVCNRLCDDICSDLASIVLLDKNQPILECVFTENQTKVAFFTINKFNLTTCAVMYIFQKSNDLFSVERHIISGKECLSFQNSLTKDSVLTDEFLKFQNSTQKYDIFSKKISLNLFARNENNEIQKYNLLKDFLFVGGKIYTKNNVSETVSLKSDPIGAEFYLCAIESDNKNSDKIFERYRLVKFFSENF